jgi:hypothetical protein
VVSHAVKTLHSASSFSPLLRNTLVGVEAVGKLLAVLVACMIRKHLLARGALECLEAGFALDGLGRGVLGNIVSSFSGLLWCVVGILRI